MKNRHSLIVAFIVFIFSGSKPVNTDVEKFINELEGLSLEEAKEYLVIKAVDFELKSRFKKLEPFNDEYLQTYSNEDEKYGQKPELLTGQNAKSNYKSYILTSKISQKFHYPKSKLNLENNSFIKIPKQPQFRIDTIFYTDGSYSTIQLFFKKNITLNSAKPVARIACMAIYTYPLEYEQINVNENYFTNNGSIEISKTKDNYIEVRFTGSFCDYDAISVLNKENKILSFNSSITINEVLAKSSEAYAKAFLTLVKKSKELKTLDELKNMLRKEFEKLPDLQVNNPATIYKAFYNGNTHAISVYYAAKSKTDSIPLYLVNTHICNKKLIFAENQDSRYGFINQEGNWILNTNRIEPINDLYFYNNDTTYFLDLQKEKLIQLPESIDLLGVNQSVAAEEKNDKYALWGINGKRVSDFIYDNFQDSNIEDVIISEIENKYGLIQSDGVVILEPVFESISTFSHNRALVKKNNQYDFINPNGKIVIDGKKNQATKPFSEGLAAIKIDGLWGFIDTLGLTKIPCMYENVEPFLNGITVVKHNGKYGIINCFNQTVVPFESGTYSLSTNFGNRLYFVGGKQYDTFGDILDSNDDESEAITTVTVEGVDL